MIQATKPTVLVDGNNSMGSHPDGWWRNRSEAAPSLATASDRVSSGLTGWPVSAGWARYRGSPPGSFAGGRRWPTHVRSVASRWIAAIVAPFVLFGLGDAWAYTFCHGRPGGETIRGFFASSEQKTRLHLFARESSDGCRLRHDGGLVSEPLSWTDAAVFEGVCRDPVTGRDWAMIYRAAGQHADLGFWSVDPETGVLELEYEEPWTVWGLEGEQLGEVVADGACRARARQDGQALLLDAVSALRSGTWGDREEPDEKQFDIPVGTSVELSTRVIPGEEVRRWLLALSAVRPAVVTFEGAHYADEASRESWTVIQVLGTRLHDAPGIVLVLDRTRNEWRALYEVLSGGSKRLSFPMLRMVVKGGKLLASLCTYCSWWGQNDHFEIDLRTHRATRLATKPQTGVDEEFNRTIPDIEDELGRSALDHDVPGK